MSNPFCVFSLRLTPEEAARLDALVRYLSKKNPDQKVSRNTVLRDALADFCEAVGIPEGGGALPPPDDVA